MPDLHLIGVHEDGKHMLLADRAGAQFRLPIDDALRSLEETVRVRDRTTSTAEKRIENTRDKVRETRQAIDLATAAGR